MKNKVPKVTKVCPEDTLPTPHPTIYAAWEAGDQDFFASPELDVLWQENDLHVDVPVRIGVYKLVEVRTVVHESVTRTRPARPSDFTGEDN